LTEEKALRAVAPAKRRQLPIGVLLLLPSLIWSTVFPFSKLVLEVIPPTLLAALRFSIGACFLTAYAIYVCGWYSFLSGWQRSWPWFIALGCSGVFLNNLLQNLGLRLTTASSGSLLSSVDPIFSVILSALFLGERMNGKKLIGLMTAFIGIILVTTNGSWILDWGDSGLGNILVVVSALSYSVYTVMSKRVLRHEDPPVVVAWSTIIGALLLSVVALLTDSVPSWWELSLPLLLSTLYLSIVPTSVSVVAYAYLLQRVQASSAAVSLFLIPAFSIVWSVLLLKEQISWATITGGSLIIVGVALAVLGGRQQLNS